VTAGRAGADRLARLQLAGTLLFGLSLRAWCFVGWGLPDDSYYAHTAFSLARGRFDLRFGSNYRLGLHLPNALSLRLFGVSDVSFVLFPLACSLATIPLTYWIGKRLAGARAGLLAAALVAASPFDVVYSTTMTIDLITACLCAAAALLLLHAEAASARAARLAQLLAALLLFQAYLVKIPALLFVAVLCVYSASAPGLWRRHAALYVALAALLAGSFLLDWAVSGDALGYWSRERATAPRLAPELGTRWYLGLYPRWMFGLTQAESPFGLTFHAALFALGYALLRRLPGRRLLVPWFLGLFLLLEFLPNRLALPYEPVPRFARYMAALLVPALLLVAIAVDDLARRHPRVAACAFAALLLSFVHTALNGAASLHDSLADTRAASRFLLAQPPGLVYSDNRMLDRINFDSGYASAFTLVHLQSLIERAPRAALLASLGPARAGYVLTGGSRGVEMSPAAILELGPARPPSEWRLLHRVDGPPTAWRREPLRIFASGR